jgi:hypothetical protein
MNSKPLIDNGRKIPVYKIHTGPGKSTMCVSRKDFEDLDAERRRLRQALIDRGVDPNDIPPVDQGGPTPREALFTTGVVDGEMNDEVVAMPKYRCHKVVWALKIRDCRGNARDGQFLLFEDSRYLPLRKDPDWFERFKPEAGGYYVVYEDWYTSFSPANAFEEGYTKLP